ncbi:MAG: hypothetical protein U5Q44_05090 [Dehalococcoidia bacterium]|nr:hypothetical protein [Dehalococcoidia bacterium]
MAQAWEDRRMPAGEAIQRTETVSTIVPGRLPGGMDALMEVLQGYRDEDAVRVVVLDFVSAGFDGELSDATRLEHFPIPLVCAWPSEPPAPAFAAGLFCDIRVGAEGLAQPPNLPPRQSRPGVRLSAAAGRLRQAQGTRSPRDW